MGHPSLALLTIFYFALSGLLVKEAVASYVRGAVAVSSNNNDKYIGYNSDRKLKVKDFEFSSSCDFSLTAPKYVSIKTGKNNNQSGSIQTPYKTIQYAISLRKPCQTIYVMGGTYRNNYYGMSQNHKNKVIDLNGVRDLKILGYKNDTSSSDHPILEFDGPGGIIGGSASNPISNIEIAGFEIIGPNANILFNQAFYNRQYKRTYYNGRGIAIWGGHHIYIHDMKVHHCPASGIRVNRGDYITIDNNEVYSSTWWSSSAESAIVLAQSKHIDTNEGTKLFLTNNLVYDNINKVPYYNPNYAWDYSPIGGLKCGDYKACEAGLIDDCPWQCRYGKLTQDYIIDGMGIYATRNSDTYLYGRFELSYNTCHGNGINGLTFHRSNRANIEGNTIYENGVVPRLDKPEVEPEDWHKKCAGKSRQPYSGLVLNNAEDVTLWRNKVTARYDDDYAYKQEIDGKNEEPIPVHDGNFNVACKGLISLTPENIVQQSSDPVQCKKTYDFVEIGCGSRCHIIQWPYTMSASYAEEDALEKCADSCKAASESFALNCSRGNENCNYGGCKGFSLQYDYSQMNGNNKFCFLYKESKEPSPVKCATDPFNTVGCTYPTENGQFFITTHTKNKYEVHDLITLI